MVDHDLYLLMLLTCLVLFLRDLFAIEAQTSFAPIFTTRELF